MAQTPPSDQLVATLMAATDAGRELADDSDTGHCIRTAVGPWPQTSASHSDGLRSREVDLRERGTPSSSSDLQYLSIFRLYGITVLQTYIYYRDNAEDSKKLKILVSI